MIARFDWQWRFGASERKLEREPHLSYRAGGVLLGGLTAVYFFWLLIHYGLTSTGSVTLPAILREMLQLLEMAGGVTLCALWGVWLWQWKRRFSSDRPRQSHRSSMPKGYQSQERPAGWCQLQALDPHPGPLLCLRHSA